MISKRDLLKIKALLRLQGLLERILQQYQKKYDYMHMQKNALIRNIQTFLAFIAKNVRLYVSVMNNAVRSVKSAKNQIYAVFIYALATKLQNVRN